jgi:RNA polymerase sigma factor (sigma-70 family)
MSNVKGAKRQRTKDALIAAYVAYTQNKSDSLPVLLNLVRQFAVKKMYTLEMDFWKTGTAETVDDWAQDVVIKVWQGLNQFSGTPDSFYPWLHRVVFNRSQDAFTMLADERTRKVPLSLKTRGTEDGNEHTQDNPDVYKSGARDVLIKIPDSIQGEDLEVCQLMIAGKTFIEIGNILELPPNTVVQRMVRLGKRMEKERNADRKRIEAERTRR